MLLRFFLPTRTQSLSKFFITTRNNEKPNYVLETMGVLSARAQGSREVAQLASAGVAEPSAAVSQHKLIA